MRYLLPMAAITAVLIPGAGLAEAKPAHHDPTQRAKSHISLHVSRHSVLSSERVVVHGRVRPGGTHRVKLVFDGPDGATFRVASKRNGAFAVRWKPSQVGAYAIRAYGVHDRRTRGSASVARKVTAYYEAHASYYGPGFYGGSLACGGTLQPDTLGVAHKTLPCGAKVKLRYRGRSVTVRVVDRGPYVAGRDFDLTEATKARLGFPDIGVVLSSR